MTVTTQNPTSFEFVKSKYSSDLDIPDSASDDDNLYRAIRDLDLSNSKVRKYLNHIRWYNLRSNQRILAAGIPYAILCFCGFLICLLPLPGLQSAFAVDRIVQPALFTAGGVWFSDPAHSTQYFMNTMTIAALAFLGAYVFTLRIFIRAVATFDLSPVTMLRATAHVILSVSGAVLIWRALPDPVSQLAGGSYQEAATRSLPFAWFFMAFIFGFVPDSGLQFIFTRGSQWIRAIKTTDDRFIGNTKSVPLDVIDGIDFFTRFRLEEANIFEVQNLAVVNPIMLHIETPFGIYQTIDWVAQAQLCTVVGPERFLMFRQHNIRTIFDLERSVLSVHSTPELRRFVGSVLTMPTQTRTRLLAESEMTYNGLGGTAATKLDGPSFDQYMAKLFWPPQSDDRQQRLIAAPPVVPQLPGPGGAAPAPAKPADPPGDPAGPPADAAAAGDPQPLSEAIDQTLKHHVRVMVDDLHVQRLRELWQTINQRLGPTSERLSDTPKLDP